MHSDQLTKLPRLQGSDMLQREKETFFQNGKNVKECESTHEHL